MINNPKHLNRFVYFFYLNPPCSIASESRVIRENRPFLFLFQAGFSFSSKYMFVFSLRTPGGVTMSAPRLQQSRKSSETRELGKVGRRQKSGEQSCIHLKINKQSGRVLYSFPAYRHLILPDCVSRFLSLSLS